MADLNLDEEASLTAMALVRAAAEPYRDGQERTDQGEIVQAYLLRAWTAQGSPEAGMDVGEPLALLIAALALLGGAAVLSTLLAATGRTSPEQVPEAEMTARLDSLELEFLAGGGFHRD